MSNKLKHLDFIQAVILRFSQNSFLIKGWAVISVSAVLAIAFREGSSQAALLAVLPTLMFWVLDGYFLAMERGYRKLYDSVRLKEETDIDFAMNLVPSSVAIKEVLESIWAISNALYYPTIVVLLIITSAFI